MKFLNKNIFVCALLLASSVHGYAQLISAKPEAAVQQKRWSTLVDEPDSLRCHKKAWEVGIGGNVLQLNRAYLSDLVKTSNGNYDYSLRLRHALFGGSVYLARELSPSFYLDLQGSLGATLVKKNKADKGTMKYAFMVGPGLQWRLSPLFNSKYIEPYLRLGVNYFHKDFAIRYSDVANLDAKGKEQVSYIMSNVSNREGRDINNAIAVSLGAGVNFWFNSKFGMGIQAAYNYMPQMKLIEDQKKVADMLQGSVNLIWRIGGCKKTNSIYVNNFIETTKTVEVPVVRVDTVRTEVSKTLCELFKNVYFEFDKSTIRPESEKSLDEAAAILKQYPDRHFLITGFTDVRGGDKYNLGLSRRRAKAVVDALEQRGVPTEMLKSRGVGKKIAYMPYNESHEVRLGDRKVTIEEVSVDLYWQKLPKSY